MSKRRRIATNCEKATFLIEKKQFHSISLRDSVELQIHLAVCATCRIYQKQSNIINKISKKFLTDAGQSPAKLDGNFKHELQEKINKRIEEK